MRLNFRQSRQASRRQKLVDGGEGRAAVRGDQSWTTSIGVAVMNCGVRVSPGKGRELAHQGVDLAGRDRHDDPLDGADLSGCNFLLPGHAKVVLDSWLALPGHGRGQSDHRRGAGIEVLRVTDGIVEVAVGFVLFEVQHAMPQREELVELMEACRLSSVCLQVLVKFTFASVAASRCSPVCVTNCGANFNVNRCSLSL